MSALHSDISQENSIAAAVMTDDSETRLHDDQVDSLKAEIEKYKAEVEEMKRINEILSCENGILKFLLDTTDTKMKELRDKLSIRCLLDQTRVKIVRTSGRNSWEELRDDFKFEALKEYISQLPGLTYDTASYLCEATNVKRDDEYIRHSD
ncbi:hypothetical protein M413DRAFT_32181 [Hebeloma cylindrosporum]|uniref:Uncharacterized protein n=1 Tax=Hebeloma cylindrosporum TaxID=76867 RepID=A0A0C3BGG8_HEBCY|nr:hypothetical protein M413DRAFT_32181 [Hebeloma cylindrosporum h7]